MPNFLLITGASRGIGYAVAKKFLSKGWFVVNLSRTPCDLPLVHNITVDLTQKDWQLKHSEAILSSLAGAAHITLVHNAGICFTDTIINLDPEQLRLTLELNVVAPAVLNQVVFPLMQPGSSIVYIGSTLSEKAVPNCATYVTSKHAVAGLMKATCQDLAQTGIHTCCICPGIIDTEMLRNRVDQNPDLLTLLKNKVTAQRLIEPEEIAELTWFTANHAVINGAVLHAHLGQVES